MRVTGNSGAGATKHSHNSQHSHTANSQSHHSHHSHHSKHAHSKGSGSSNSSDSGSASSGGSSGDSVSASAPTTPNYVGGQPASGSFSLPTTGESGSTASGLNLGAFDLQTPSDLKADPNGSSQYVQHSGSGVTFSVNDNESTTAGSTHPRSELREKKDWHIADGTSSLSATAAVNKVPPDGKVIIGQIKGDSTGDKHRPLATLEYDNGSVYATVVADGRDGTKSQKIPLASGVSLGSAINYNMTMKPDGTLNFSVNGKTGSTHIDPNAWPEGLYFKAGAYDQTDNPSDGGSASVTFNALNVNHSQ